METCPFESKDDKDPVRGEGGLDVLGFDRRGKVVAELETAGDRAVLVPLLLVPGLDDHPIAGCLHLDLVGGEALHVQSHLEEGV